MFLSKWSFRYTSKQVKVISEVLSLKREPYGTYAFQNFQTGTFQSADHSYFVEMVQAIIVEIQGHHNIQ